MMSEKIFKLCFLSRKNEPPAKNIDEVEWEFISESMEEVYGYGGFLYLKIESNENSYIKELHFIAREMEFRIIAMTRDKDKKRELLEWWNPSLREYIGESLFLDDAYDSRMTSNDLEVGKEIFRDFYENSDLMPCNLENFRSQWDPLPH
ncbi:MULTISPECIES: DUF6911 family protein [Comamonas]|jgi:hypothetical protein|nr:MULTISPECIES: hypothetical protein [Comamonas]MPS89037.1 hypothetical protein [Comamonas sp.]